MPIDLAKLRAFYGARRFAMRKRLAALALFAVMAAIGFGCGGAHTSPTAPAAATNQPAPASTVQAVTINGGGQTTMALPIGQSVQLTATAQMADGSSADVSALAAWSSDN